jgi:hypothetical protein
LLFPQALFAILIPLKNTLKNGHDLPAVAAPQALQAGETWPSKIKVFFKLEGRALSRPPTCTIFESDRHQKPILIP